MNFSSWVIPVLLAGTAICVLLRRKDGYTALIEGARQGLSVTVRILPSLVVLLSAAAMFRASGALDRLTTFLSPVLSAAGLPPETAPLLLIRPLSGSGALAAGGDLITQYGPDSYIGRVAAVMLGSTETTFYTVSVYFGAAGIRRSRYAVPAALVADAVGFLVSAVSVRLLFGCA